MAFDKNDNYNEHNDFDNNNDNNKGYLQIMIILMII